MSRFFQPALNFLPVPMFCGITRYSRIMLYYPCSASKCIVTFHALRQNLYRVHFISIIISLYITPHALMSQLFKWRNYTKHSKLNELSKLSQLLRARVTFSAVQISYSKRLGRLLSRPSACHTSLTAWTRIPGIHGKHLGKKCPWGKM